MIKEYISKDQDLSSRKRMLILRTTIGVPLFGFAFVSLIYSWNYHEGKRLRGWFSRAIDGITYMSAMSIVISLTSFILFTLIAIAFFNHHYGEREIVVGLKFDDDRRELTVKSKTIVGKEFTRTHKYSELSWEQDRLSDGLTTMYNTLTLVKGKYLVGHIFTKHFTWDEETIAELKTKLRAVLQVEPPQQFK